MKSPISILVNSTSNQDCGVCTVGNQSASSSTLKCKNKNNDVKPPSKVYLPLHDKDSMHNDYEEEVGVQIKSTATMNKSTTKTQKFNEDTFK